MRIRLSELKRIIGTEVRHLHRIVEATDIDRRIDELTNAIRQFYVDSWNEGLEDHDEIVNTINACVERGVQNAQEIYDGIE